MSHFLDWKYISLEQGKCTALNSRIISCITPYSFHSQTHNILYVCLLYAATSLEGALSDGALRSILSEALRLSTLYDEARCRVALDLYADCYLYCKSQAFCAHRTSTLLSIAADAFIRDTSNRSPAYSMTSSFEQLRDAVLRHSVERPPRRYGIITFVIYEIVNIYLYVITRIYLIKRRANVSIISYCAQYSCV